MYGIKSLLSTEVEVSTQLTTKNSEVLPAKILDVRLPSLRYIIKRGQTEDQIRSLVILRLL